MKGHRSEWDLDLRRVKRWSKKKQTMLCKQNKVNASEGKES